MEDEAPEEGAPKLCISFLSQVCVCVCVCVLEGVLPTPGVGGGGGLLNCWKQNRTT